MLPGTVWIAGLPHRDLVTSGPGILLLTLIVGLTFGDVIFSTRPIAPTIKTAFNAVMLLVGMSLTGSGSNAASNFYARIAQVMLAVVYVAAAFGFLEYLQRKRVKKA